MLIAQRSRKCSLVQHDGGSLASVASVVSHIYTCWKQKKKHTRKRPEPGFTMDDVNVSFFVKPSHTCKHTMMHVPNVSQPVRNNHFSSTLMSTAAFWSRLEPFGHACVFTRRLKTDDLCCHV